jgi:hypothetical protein
MIHHGAARPQQTWKLNAGFAISADVRTRDSDSSCRSGSCNLPGAVDVGCYSLETEAAALRRLLAAG